MGNVTDDQPKCFAKWGDKKLFEWQLMAFHQAGVRDIAVVTGYKSESFRKFDIVKFHNPDWSTTNMVYSLSLANEWLVANECLVAYSDIVFSPGIIRALAKSQSDISIAYDTDWLRQWRERFSDVLSDAETFRINENGDVYELGKKASSISEIQGQYMGLLKITPMGWAKLTQVWRESTKNLMEKTQMTHLLNAGLETSKFSVYGVKNQLFWHEVDNQNDLAILNRHSPDEVME